MLKEGEKIEVMNRVRFLIFIPFVLPPLLFFNAYDYRPELEIAISESHGQSYNPPVAMRIPSQLSLHNVTLFDDYDWMREGFNEPTSRQHETFMNYIDAENSFTDLAIVRML
jgi:hypothetical protein